MSANTRFVFDTNTIVSALLFHQSNPGRALRQGFAQGTLLLSTDVTQELAEVLRREKFDQYVQRKTREAFLRTLVQTARFVTITESIEVCRDPKDDKFLELAVCGQASHLISGDDDLLALNPFRGISIVNPTQFLNTVLFSE